MKTRIQINGVLGLLKDAFNKLAFESVQVSHTDRWNSDLKKYAPSIFISFKTKTANPNDDKYGNYLSVLHGFVPLQRADEEMLANKTGLVMESVERIIATAVDRICNYGANANYVSRVI